VLNVIKFDISAKEGCSKNAIKPTDFQIISRTKRQKTILSKLWTNY